MASSASGKGQDNAWKAACVAYTWGSTPAERRMPAPCDQYLAACDDVYFRAVDVHAPDRVLFRWLCQLKAAPYSYDWLDNFGRQSPPYLIAGLENLAVGQRVMTIFRLVAFEPQHHLTMVLDSAPAQQLFGQIALSYMVLPQQPTACRLLVKLRIRYPRNLARLPMQVLLPWGDVFMMRKQVLTLKRLAEADAAQQTRLSSAKV